MSKKDDIDIGVGLLLFGGTFFYHGWEKIRKLNKIKDSSRQMIAYASAGEVEFEALAWPLKSPALCIEGKKCIYLSVTLEEYKTSGKSKRWVPIWTYHSYDPFLAFDKSGFVKVDPRRIHDVEVTREKIYYPKRMN